MSEVDDHIDIRRVHDNDKYVIRRTVLDEVNGEKLTKIYNEINEGIKFNEDLLLNLEKSIKERMKAQRNNIVADKLYKLVQKEVDDELEEAYNTAFKRETEELTNSIKTLKERKSKFEPFAVKLGAEANGTEEKNPAV